MTISTLLDMTQSILSAMGSDQVNSISDTVESAQVAECIRQTYFNMLGRYDLPEHNQFAQLVQTNSTTPTLMTLPLNASRMEWVTYFDTNPVDTTSLQVDQFGAFSHGLNTDIIGSSLGFGLSSNTNNTIALGTQVFQAALITLALPPTIGKTIFCYPTSGGGIGGGNLPPFPLMTGTVTGVVNSPVGSNQYTVTCNITSITGTGLFSTWLLTQFATGLPFGPGYINVVKLTIEDFMNMTTQFDLTESNVGSYTLAITPEAGGAVQDFTIYYKNDHQPQYCCVLSNNFVMFDSYDSSQDQFLQADKTLSYIWTIPSWTMSDAFVPALDPQHFPLLLNDAKALAFMEIKQLPHQKAEDEVARQLVSLQKWKAISGKPSYFDEIPSFGRRGGSLSGYDSKFRVPGWRM